MGKQTLGVLKNVNYKIIIIVIIKLLLLLLLLLFLFLLSSCFRTLDFQWNFSTPGSLVTTSLLKRLGPS